MDIRLYNTLTRSLEDLRPMTPGQVGIYACGPTVYTFVHIGNLRAYIFVDVLRRMLEVRGYTVKLVMNITDVGHLTSDEDEGDDKMLVGMRREGKSAYDIASFYTETFLFDAEALNILAADVYPKATDHIAEQIALVEALEKKGFTYQTQDGVYFDTSKLASYGRLSGQKASEKQAGARVDMGEKRNATDFALWKFAPQEAVREMIWPSPWGEGFPGWHLECSAMSAKYLGVPFDIHTGGIDHVAVHHENELAQTEGATGKLEANIWMHNEFLTVDGGKMSKSLGNAYTLTDLRGRGFDPLAFRYACLQVHYRSKMNFTWEALEAAQNALKKLRHIVRSWDRPNETTYDKEASGAILAATFFLAMEHDLDTPKALATLWKLVDDTNEPSSEKARALLKMDEVLGLGLADYVGRPLIIPEAVQALVQSREQTRTEKDWKRSDALREEIFALGFVVEDSAEGTIITER